jgi:hypothetical protein
MRLLATLALAVPLASPGNEISVGAATLNIPNPPGFVPVTAQMSALFDFGKSFVAPSNEEFVAFIPASGKDAALRGEIPDLTRRLTVQTAKTLINASAGTSDFANLKHTVKSQNQELIKKLERQLPDLMKTINQGLSEKYDLNAALSISQMVPFPTHEETNNTLSYSSLVNYTMKDADGKDAPFVVVVTATFVHIKGKILFLYCYADEKGLAWSREISKQWSDAVVAANPGGHPSKLAINWKEVGEKALIGALIGAFIGLVGWIRNRRKAS